MKPFEIFRAGRHTSTSGAVAEYSDAMLRAAVEAYDPKLHPAPIVVGHPKDNHPAFGWIDKLSVDADGNLIGHPADVDPSFSELVQRKAYRTRSASFYLPDAPQNPKPGSLYLRHVGFLGAQPPAIKGLKDVSFAEDEQGVVEFADPEVGLLANFLRRLREFFLAEHGKEKADEVAPDWMVGEFEALARTPAKTEGAQLAYAEPEAPNSEEESTVSAEKIAAMEAENARLKAELEQERAAAKQTADKQSADFAERAADLDRRAAELARREIETKVDALIAAGKVLPAQRTHTVNFAASLSDDGECIDFAETGKGKDVLSQRASYLRMLENGPKLVEFGEVAKDERQGGAPKAMSEVEVAQQARDFMEEQQKKGITVSATSAVAHIMAQQEKLAG